MKIIVDDGFLFGAGVFETIKVEDGRAIFCEEHLRRLQKSLDFFDISQKISVKEIQAYLATQKEKNFALKIVVSARNILYLKRENPYLHQEKDRGVRLCFSKVLRNSSSAMVYHKTTQYYENLLEKKKAKQRQYDEVVFWNERGELAEGAVSNLFFLKGDQLYTPPVSCGLLPGIMRGKIMEYYPVEEKRILPEDLLNFDACFLTNSLMGVLWVREVGGIFYQKTKKIEKILAEQEAWK
ncbi:aminotransferase class IV [Fusobacterium necrophorum]|uniref:aminotransferase class IV n=1 Tax=Fusobacterium necrophorum TaxID=859 RepID=UPI00370DF1F9